MKVKNIMFSGFMAVILMGVAGNASAAVQIASKAYVDGELASKASNADLGTANAAIAQNAENIAKKADKLEIGTLPADANEGVDTVYEYITQKTSGIATDENLGALTERVTTAESDIDALESAMTGEGEGSVAKKISDALVGYATEDYVGTQIQSATENMATDTEVQNAINALSATGGAIANLSGTVDGISGRVTELENADYQNANQVSGAITTAISDLNLAGTYEAKGAAATVQGNVDTLAGRVTAAEGKITIAEGEIDTLQSEMDAVELKAAANTTAIEGKVAQDAYDTKMSALDAAIAAKFELPAGCTGEGANCVLSSIGGTIQWVDITAPLQ